MILFKDRGPFFYSFEDDNFGKDNQQQIGIFYDFILPAIKMVYRFAK